MLHIIPVIDLLDGVVVHAKKGHRASYQPIKSLLTSSANPLDIVKAFMDIYPFKTLYIADLNQIQKHRSTHNLHDKIINKIANEYPKLKLWVDAGISTATERQHYHTMRVTPILASESFSSIQAYRHVKTSIDGQYILSLDYLPDGYHGPEALCKDIKHWPNDVIVMTLDKVGANSGVDIQKLQSIITLAKMHNIYAAGGIRTVDDLQFLKRIGVTGALIATALHNKTLTTEMLNQLT